MRIPRKAYILYVFGKDFGEDENISIALPNKIAGKYEAIRSLVANGLREYMIVRCTYCPHEYVTRNKIEDELNQEILQHVRVSHPDKWKTCRPNDIWIIVVPDKA